MKKWTVDKKVVFFGIVVVVTTLVSVLSSIYSTSRINETANRAIQGTNYAAMGFSRQSYLNRLTVSTLEMIIFNDKSKVDIAKDGDYNNSPMGKKIKEVLANPSNFSPAVVDIIRTLEPHAIKYYESLNKVYNLIAQGKDEEAGKFFRENMSTAAEQVSTIYVKVTDVYKDEADQDIKSNSSFISTVKTLSIFLGTLLVLLFAGGTFLIVMALRSFANKLVVSTDTVNSGSNEISKGNQDLSARTQQQASSLEETASTIEEITSTVKQTADNSQRATQLAHHAVESAREGTGLSEQAQKAMVEISGSSNKIAEIVNLVNEIAFQTNILAINAAIEAAKAGEQGKGFAVVAIEVRSLAQRSAEAAKEIKELIVESINKVTNGGHLVESNANKLKEIALGIQQVSDIVNEISAASREQYNAIEQINKAIAELDSVTQQNSALVEEIASASENMSAESSEMNKIVQENLTVKKGNVVNHHTVTQHSINVEHNKHELHAHKKEVKEKGDDDVINSILKKNNKTGNSGEDF